MCPIGVNYMQIGARVWCNYAVAYQGGHSIHGCLMMNVLVSIRACCHELFPFCSTDIQLPAYIHVTRSIDCPLIMFPSYVHGTEFRSVQDVTYGSFPRYSGGITPCFKLNLILENRFLWLLFPLEYTLLTGEFVHRLMNTDSSVL